MQPLSRKRHRFPPDVVRLAVWRYFRFTLRFRDVEEMLAQPTKIQTQADRSLTPGRDGREDPR